MSYQEHQEKKLLEAKERYTFIRWGKRFHIISSSHDILCGRPVPPQTKPGKPDRLEQVCRTCWWNKE